MNEQIKNFIQWQDSVDIAQLSEVAATHKFLSTVWEDGGYCLTATHLKKVLDWCRQHISGTGSKKVSSYWLKHQCQKDICEYTSFKDIEYACRLIGIKEEKSCGLHKLYGYKI